MRLRNPILRLMFFIVLLHLLSSCDREQPIATLRIKQGDVQRESAAQLNAWHAATIGVGFNLGDALRTAISSTATLDLDDGGKLQVREDTTVRFSAERPKAGQQAFDVEAGQVLLEAGPTGLVLATGKGMARLDAGSKLSIGRTKQGLKFEITVGKAQLEVDGGTHVLQQPGQTYLVSVGDAVLERSEPSAAKPEAEPIAPTSSVAEPVSGHIQARVFGSGVSQKTTSGKDFQKLPPGSTALLAGTTLRIDAKSHVELQHEGASVNLSGMGTYLIRSGAAFVELQSGRISATGAMRIAVPGGVIETARETSTSLESLDRDHSVVRVARGLATVKGKQGETLVAQGQEAKVASDGSTQLAGGSLAYADFALQIGDSVTVHDPKPPTATRFVFGSHCPAGGTLRTSSPKSKAFASGQGSVSLALNAGNHEYALYCFGENGVDSAAVARGSITIVQDAGTRPVPNKPPTTSVNIDGLRYTVTYQNQLPNLNVVWPNAPPSSSYKLFVESRNGKKILTSSAPSYTFRSGTLQEGTHQIHFEGGGKFSRHTKVEIAFDNAAPKASLETPVETNVRAGGELTVMGIAQPGWSVEIAGTKVDQDPRQRFVQRATMPSNERALAIKLTHPVRGTHVYLRRSARANGRQ